MFPSTLPESHDYLYTLFSPMGEGPPGPSRQVQCPLNVEGGPCPYTNQGSHHH